MADAAFDLLVDAAVRGIRCPANDHKLLDKNQVGRLCREGKVRIFISGHNFRQVEILIGEHAKKKTAPNPSGAQPWKILDKNGVHRPDADGTLKPFVPHDATRRGRRPEPWRPGQPKPGSS